MAKTKQTANQKKAQTFHDAVVGVIHSADGQSVPDQYATNQHPVACPNCGAEASGYDLMKTKFVKQTGYKKVPVGHKSAMLVVSIEDRTALAETTVEVVKADKVAELIACSSCGKSFKDGEEWSP